MRPCLLAGMLATGLSVACSLTPARQAGIIRVEGVGGVGQVIELAQGQSLEIRLRSNPSTGYRWVLASGYPVGLLRPVDGTPLYEADTRVHGLVGSGGIETWQLLPVEGRSGKGRVRFEYRRPWEVGPAAEVVEYAVDVHP